MNNFKGIVLALAGLVLFYSYPAQARRTKNLENITVSLHRTLVEIGYEQEVEEITSLITEIFPNLQNLQILSPKGKVAALDLIIRANMGGYAWKKGMEVLYLELPEALRSKKCICSSAAELFYVLGKSLGLDVEIMPVFSIHHMTNLIKLNGDYIILDLGMQYISPVFNWEENYEQEAGIWYLKEGSSLPERYKTVQRINGQIIASYRYVNIGGKLGILERHEESIAASEKAIEINPNSAHAYYNLGNSKMGLGQYQEAIEAYKKAIEINPLFFEALHNLGGSLDTLGRHEEAIEAYKKAIEINPLDAYAYYNLGVSLTALGQHEEAIEANEIVTGLNPNMYQAWVNSAFSKYRMGQIEEAIEDIRRAIAIEPEVYDHLPPEIQEKLLEEQ